MKHGNIEINELPIPHVHRPAPLALSLALARHRGVYTDMRTIFHCIQLQEYLWVGVAGDGSNGSYEFFIFSTDSLQCSDVGYGDSAIALRDVLIKTVE